ncbi:hypothetical protein NW754_007208 [Fusarium falciforme]|nr:hypothetical protein NW754_007208 [Fusarium falciforme]KAJ4206094.1 hypothetical protein NW767_003340 [Fusarium falciforme]
MSTTALHGQTPLPLAVRDEGCGFEGKSDLYGLGIRLGIYMQWLSTFVTDFESLTPLWETYSIFIFAIFIAILVLTAEERPTHTAEMSILTYIVFGGAYMMLPANMRMRKVTSSNGKALLNHYAAMNLISGIVACYFFWFWLRGMHGDNFLATPCGSYGFLFAKVSLSDQHVTNIFAAASAIRRYDDSNCFTSFEC